MAEKKIRVGIITDNFIVPAWIYLMLKKIVEADFVDIVLVAKLEGNQFNSIKKKKRTFSFTKQYLSLEKKIREQNYSAYAAKNIGELIKHNTFIGLPIEFKENSIAEVNDIKKIKTYQPDVLINISALRLNGKILGEAKCGIWAYSAIPDIDGVNTLQSINWGTCTAGISLKMYTNKYQEGHTLYESFSAKSVVLNKNINWVYFKASSFVHRQIKALSKVGVEHFIDNAEWRKSQDDNESKGCKQQISFSLIRHFARLFRTFISVLFNRRQWVLLYTLTDKIDLPVQIKNYKEIKPPRDRFWADPCVVNFNNRHYIFIEEHIYKKKKAHISFIEIDAAGKISEPQIVLEKPYHLSYPFVFKDGNDIYMIPETSADKSIQLYKCVSFPDEWVFEMNVMENIHAVDATIYYDGNKYWLFVNLRENEGASDWDELFLFSSDRLLSKNWNSHPQNPIISDVRSARPAGSIFSAYGKLYRPSQDCSCTYGYAININEIITLTETEYLERKITTIFPWDKNIIAAHTFSATEGLCIIDAKKN